MANFLSLASPRDLVVIIDGLDVSELVINGSGQFPQFTENGLFVITGQITLGFLHSFSESLDNRINPRWSKGKQIVITFGGDQAPIIGTTYIDGAEYDFRNRQLNITFTDVLGLNNNTSPGELGICLAVEAGDGLSPVSGTGNSQVAKAITSILARLNIPFDPISIELIPGVIWEQEYLDETESFITYIGSLAFSNGYYLYQDRFGVVKADSITNFKNQNLVFTGDGTTLPVYERINEIELPPDKVIATGQLGRYLKRADQESVQNLYSLIFRTVSYEERSDRIVTKSALETIARPVTFEGFFPRVPIIVGSFFSTISRFDLRSITSRNIFRETSINTALGDASPEFYPGDGRLVTNQEFESKDFENKSLEVGEDSTNCVPNDPGRLLFRVFVSLENVKILYSDWFIERREYLTRLSQSNSTALPPAILEDLIDFDNIYFGSTLGTAEFEAWDYNTPSNKNVSCIEAQNPLEGEYFVKHRVSKYENITKAFPLSGARDLGSQSLTSRIPYNLEPLINLDAEIEVERLEENWNLNEDEKTWTYKVVNYRLAYNASRNAIQTQINSLSNGDLSGVTLETEIEKIAQQAITLVPTSVRIDDRAALSEGSNFPREVDVAFKAFREEIIFTTNNSLAKNKVVTLGNNIESCEVAIELARALGNIEWSRSKGQTLGIPVNSISSFDIIPFSKVVVSDFLINEESNYALDGVSIFFDQKRALINSDALWISTINTIDPDIQFLPITPIPQTTLPYHLRVNLIASVNTTISTLNANLPYHLLFVFNDLSVTNPILVFTAEISDFIHLNVNLQGSATQTNGATGSIPYHLNVNLEGYTNFIQVLLPNHLNVNLQGSATQNIAFTTIPNHLNISITGSANQPNILIPLNQNKFQLLRVLQIP